MRFETVPILAAEGAILAHSLKAGGQRLGKGRTLSAEDIADLSKNGVSEITVARLEAGDIAEDAAAATLAAKLCGEGTRTRPAFTGRTNLYASLDGLVILDPTTINKANLVDDALTIATLSPHAMVAKGDMVATVKVIPYAAPKASVERAAEIVETAPIKIAAFKQMKAALITTEIEKQKSSVVVKARNTMTARLKPLGGTIVFEAHCPHTAEAVAQQLQEAKRAGAEIFFVLGASAISDRRDIIPAGIERARGSVIHFGMPVDPGNLLLLGKLDGKFVIGLPGCARSPKVNGLDLVLRRIFAGIDVSREDIMRMGVGGLLSEMSDRPQPRNVKEGNVKFSKDQAKKPKIAALVLAAGLSSRMGSNKLLAELEGVPLIRKTVEAALNSEASTVIVVTGHQSAMVQKALEGLDVAYAHNSQYGDGISSSLRTGIVTLPEDCDGAIVMLGDMPEISSALLDRMMDTFAPEEGRTICVTTSNGKRGNPVLWARRHFAEIEQITGDTGAKHLISKYEDMVVEVPADDTVLLDVDTPDALEALRARTSALSKGA